MDRKIRYGFADAKTIMSIVVVLIILVVGLMAVGTITTQQDNLGVGPKYQGTFTVTDPSVNQNCNIGNEGATNIVVRQRLSNGTIETIGAGDYTYTGNSIVVDAGALYG